MKINSQSFEKRKTAIISLDLITHKDLPQYCEICGSRSYPSRPIMKGPFMRYEKRENELYFDLVRKYYYCGECGYEFDINDFQIMVEKLARDLPPKEARVLTMRFMDGYRENPRETKQDLLKLIKREMELEEV